MWIGSPLSQRFPQIFASILAAPDMFLLALYVISMYFSVRFSSPPSPDPAQAQQQKIMAFMSPLIIAFVGNRWPSALILYWLTSNVFSTSQQFYLMRVLKKKITVPPLVDNETAKMKSPKNVTPSNGSTSNARKKRSRR